MDNSSLGKVSSSARMLRNRYVMHGNLIGLVDDCYIEDLIGRVCAARKCDAQQAETWSINIRGFFETFRAYFPVGYQFSEAAFFPQHSSDNPYFYEKTNNGIALKQLVINYIVVNKDVPPAKK